MSRQSRPTLCVISGTPWTFAVAAIDEIDRAAPRLTAAGGHRRGEPTPLASDGGIDRQRDRTSPR